MEAKRLLKEEHTEEVKCRIFTSDNVAGFSGVIRFLNDRIVLSGKKKKIIIFFEKISEVGDKRFSFVPLTNLYLKTIDGVVVCLFIHNKNYFIKKFLQRSINATFIKKERAPLGYRLLVYLTLLMLFPGVPLSIIIIRDPTIMDPFYIICMNSIIFGFLYFYFIGLILRKKKEIVNMPYKMLVGILLLLPAYGLIGVYYYLERFGQEKNHGVRT